MAKIGVAIISDGQPWEQNRDIIRRMKAEIIRVRTPVGFGFIPEQLDDIIVDNPMLRTIVLCTEDAVVTPEQVESEIVGRGFYEVIKRNPTVDAVLELGNEHNLKGVNTWTHRYDALQTLQQLKPRLALPNLRWSVSLPTTLSDTIDLLSRDQHGCILDHIDVHTAHWYGWYEIGDGAGDRGKWNDILDYLVRHTTLPILITETGIDDRATPRDEKARRYLSWAATAHPRIEGACFWGVGEWQQNPSYEIDPAMADVLGSRHTEPQQPPTPEPEPHMPYSNRSPINGTGTVSAAAIDAWFIANGPTGAGWLKLPYEVSPPIGEAIVRYSALAGKNSDLVAGQIAHETAYLQSRIWRDKRNPAGLGATNDNAYAGAIMFATPEEGVRATLAHLCSYVDGEGHPLQEYSVRHKILRDLKYLGVVKILKDLEQRWAWSKPAEYNATPEHERYGAKIAEKANALVQFAKSHPEQEQPMSPYPFIRGLIDIRGQLPRRYNQGENRHVPLNQKIGAVVHYSGPPVNMARSDLDTIKSEAQYHVTKNWGNSSGFVGGDGYMYHIVIGRNGEKWLCRDLESVLWHCGAWPQNGTALSVHLPIGGSQRATKPQLQALAEVIDDWYAAGHGNKHTQTWGHKELDSTDCPGTLQWEFVIPYREGKIVTIEDTNIHFEETSHGIGGGFYQWWKRNNGMITMGFPLTDEFDVDDESAPEVPGKMPAGKRRMQVFQGGVLVWLPEMPTPWDVQRVHVTHPRFMEFVKHAA